MNRNQRGMTLIEVILVVSITAILAGAGATTYFQVMKGSGMSNNRAEAISDIERASDQFTIDALQMQGRPMHGNPAQDIPRVPATPVVTLNWPITLIWIDDTESWYMYKAVYEIVGTDLKRTLYIDDDDDDIDNYVLDNTGIVARNIVSANTICKYNWMEDIFYLTIRATVGRGDFDRVTEERSYEIIPRTNLS
jgi:prepilin-type N-terminal cleavage/methylation domain-containing protein